MSKNHVTAPASLVGELDALGKLAHDLLTLIVHWQRNKDFTPRDLATMIIAAGYTRTPSSPLVGELGEALGKWLSHGQFCGHWYDRKCDCGLESALARAGKERG